MYTIDNDGEETTVKSEASMRVLAKRNGLLDTDDMPIEDVIECLMECFPDLTITAA